jgi:hypothetical protein
MPRVETYNGALVVPATDWQPSEKGRRFVYDGGVCTAEGEPVQLGQHFGGQHRNRTRPTPGLVPAAQLKGRWLFGGWLRGHFGHMVNESLGRLWAVDAAPWAGIVFLRYGRDLPQAAAALTPARGREKLLEAFLDLLGITAEVVVAEQPVQVERLVVPEQCRLGPTEEDLDSHRVLRRYLAGAAARGIVPAEPIPEKVYVSRSQLEAHKAKFVLETAIEANLARAGYAIVHPERMSLTDQVLLYRGARTLIFAEGSAVHMAVPHLGPGQRVAVLWRQGHPHHLIQPQLQACDLDQLVDFGAFTGIIYSQESREEGEGPTAKWRKIQVIPDFDNMGAVLEAAGFIHPGCWRSPTVAERQAAIEAHLEERRQLRPRQEHAFVSATSIPEALREQPRAGTRRDEESRRIAKARLDAAERTTPRVARTPNRPG